MALNFGLPAPWPLGSEFPLFDLGLLAAVAGWTLNFELLFPIPYPPEPITYLRRFRQRMKQDPMVADVFQQISSQLKNK